MTNQEATPQPTTAVGRAAQAAAGMFPANDLDHQQAVRTLTAAVSDKPGLVATLRDHQLVAGDVFEGEKWACICNRWAGQSVDGHLDHVADAITTWFLRDKSAERDARALS